MTGHDTNQHGCRIGATAEIVKLSEAPEVYGVFHVDRDGEQQEARFTGSDAGRRAYAHATAFYDDVKTGRSASARPE